MKGLGETMRTLCAARLFYGHLTLVAIDSLAVDFCILINAVGETSEKIALACTQIKLKLSLFAEPANLDVSLQVDDIMLLPKIVSIRVMLKLGVDVCSTTIFQDPSRVKKIIPFTEDLDLTTDTGAGDDNVDEMIYRLDMAMQVKFNATLRPLVCRAPIAHVSCVSKGSCPWCVQGVALESSASARG